MSENSKRKNEGGDGEEEDELDDTQFKHEKDAILFMIDVNKSMLVPQSASEDKGGEGDSALSASLKCAYELMTLRIISNPNDLMGVLLHGVEQSSIPQDESVHTPQDVDICPHDHLLVDLSVPSATDVKRLKDFFEDRGLLQNLVPVSKSRSLANTLFSVSGLFGARAANFASRRLFIVTDSDDPNASDERLKSLATQRAKDLFDLGVIIELFPVVRPGEDFNRGKFYNDIIYNDVPGDPDAAMPVSRSTQQTLNEKGSGLLSSLLSSLRSRIVPKRALFANLPLEMGPGLTISVKGYIVFKRQEPRKTSYIWLGGEEPQIAVGKSGKIADDTGQPVIKPEIRKAYKFGGEQISFSTDEIAGIRNFGDPVIRIVGFKASGTDSLPIWANLKGATFLYPSEEDFVGSTRVFSALQQKMLKNKRVAIAWFVARKNATPQVAAIAATVEQVDENGGHILPSGLWLIPLPFADDIRDNPEEAVVLPPDPLIDKMRQIVQQLQLPKGQYVPAKYPNPALQWHYRVLEAMALQEEAPAQPEDKTKPKYRQISKRAGGYIQEWGEDLSKEHQRWEEEHRGTTTLPKRSAPTSIGNPTSSNKRAKIAGNAEVNDEQMKRLIRENEVGKLTLPNLKGWLSAKNLSTSGRKADLVERVESQFEKK